MPSIPEPYTPPLPGLTPGGLLRWVCRRQSGSIAVGTVCDIVWLLGLALTPWAIGRVIDQGVVPQDAAAFGVWIVVVVVLQLQHSLIQGLRDRAGILNWRRGYSRVNQLVTRAAARNGTAAERTVPPGSVVTMAVHDASTIAFLPINIGSITSAIVAYVVVGALLVHDSPLLGLLVIVGVPLFSGLLFVLVRPLRERQSAYRTAVNELNTVATDSVRGLRVLRGVGGERRFLERYREKSAIARTAGVRVSWPLSWSEALKTAVSGVLVVGLTWVGAALVVQGQLRAGELVAFYGYAGFMVLPVTLVSQAITVAVQATVGARRILALLDIPPLVTDGGRGGATDSPARTVPVVVDQHSGLEVHDGEFLGVVSAVPADALRIADRLARLSPDDDSAPVLLGGVRAAGLPVEDVRRRIVISDAVPYLFSGTLRSLLDPHERHDDDELAAALDAADAGDVLEAAALGFDTRVGERGLQFSGGQRQRLGVARSLLADAEVLVLLEPTASVDAATEARMAAGIRASRQGATTVIASTSPLLLTEADRVVVLRDGRVVASGTHRDLLDADEQYRSLVMRGEGLG